MNKKTKIALTAVTLMATTLYAADSGMGTYEDPIVTKSYVDQKVAEVKSSINGGVTSTELAAQNTIIKELQEEIEILKSTQNSIYEVVTVAEGQTIIGEQSTEMIVRAGEGIIVASNAGGVQDITSGLDIASGQIAPKNHLLLIPRSDGRGLLANKKLTVMVRGGYKLQ